MQLRLIRLHRPTAVVLTLVLTASLAAVGAYLLASWVLLPAGN
jgi:phage shock protein PspC (stress-responsive transcriptional regulator)